MGCPDENNRAALVAEAFKLQSLIESARDYVNGRYEDRGPTAMRLLLQAYEEDRTWAQVWELHLESW